MSDLERAEAEFDAYYERGGKGLADDVWRRIASKWGVYRSVPKVS